MCLDCRTYRKLMLRFMLPEEQFVLTLSPVLQHQHLRMNLLALHLQGTERCHMQRMELTFRLTWLLQMNTAFNPGYFCCLQGSTSISQLLCPPPSPPPPLLPTPKRPKPSAIDGKCIDGIGAHARAIQQMKAQVRGATICECMDAAATSTCGSNLNDHLQQ